jgi:uncharacterized protein
MKKWLPRAAVVAWCASAGWAADWKALKPQGYVSDFAGVIEAAPKARLEEYCAAMERASGVEIMLVTIASLQGEPVEDVAAAMARAWQAGQKGKEGILLLLAIQERRYGLEISAGLERVLPYGLNGSVLSEMRPALHEQQYGEALMAAAETLGGAVANARHVAGGKPLPRRIRPGFFRAFPWALAIGSLVLLVWLMRAGGPRDYGFGGMGFLPWLVMGSMTGRSTWGGRGSGGFGGYDSGDGFAGFGGGDFGGGGSSDW